MGPVVRCDTRKASQPYGGVAASDKSELVTVTGAVKTGVRGEGGPLIESHGVKSTSKW
jgi:hypothetical protein